MKLWSDFFDYVLTELPGVPQDLATIAIRSAAIDFMDQTGIYVYQQPAVNIVAGQSDYALVAPSSNYDVARVGSAWVETNEILPIGEDALRKKMYNWTTQTGYPTGFLHTDPYYIKLIPIPDTSIGSALTLRLVIRPARTGTGVEDWIFNKYVEQVAAGAKYRLAAMPQKPWSAPDIAMYNGKLYETGLMQATAEATKSYTRASLQVNLRRTI